MLMRHYNPALRMQEFRKGFDMLNTMLDEFSQKEQSEFDFNPTINTREGEDAYYLEVDLPGLKKDEIDIRIEDNTLIISGERRVKNEMKRENYYKIESSFGKFSRSFALPDDIDVDKINAESENGVLEIVVPKLEVAEVEKVKKITIN